MTLPPEKLSEIEGRADELAQQIRDGQRMYITDFDGSHLCENISFLCAQLRATQAELEAATHENERLRDLVEYAFREGMQAGAYSVEWTRAWEDDEWLDSTTQAALASPAPEPKG